jgi:hypothetical protein
VSLKLANITFDCTDAAATAEFWAKALDRSPGEPYNRWAARLPAAGPAEPALLFLAVPEPKDAKNRVHLDLAADDRDAEVARLVGLGATVTGEHDEYGVRWTVLHDPQDNEFCVAQRPPD